MVHGLKVHIILAPRPLYYVKILEEYSRLGFID